MHSSFPYMLGNRAAIHCLLDIRNLPILANAQLKTVAISLISRMCISHH